MDKELQNLLAALKDNVKGKQSLIEQLIGENRELTERLTDLAVEYYHYRGADAENNRAFAQAKKLLRED